MIQQLRKQFRMQKASIHLSPPTFLMLYEGISIVSLEKDNMKKKKVPF
jgi:hypothetical protein